jgi:hypothetical protein
MKKHWANQSDFTTFNEPACKRLEERCGKHFNGTAYLLARALAPGADLSAWSPEDRDEVMAALDSYCVPLLGKLGGADPAQFKTEFGKWVVRSGPLAMPPDPVPEPEEYWQSVALHVPLVSKVALTIFAISPSEACVERSFSHQGLLYSELRTRLGDDSVEALMMVRMNVAGMYDVPCVEPRAKKPKTEDKKEG